MTPRLGFVGVGRMGRQRMRALASSGAAQVCCVADAAAEVARAAAAEVSGAEVVRWEQMLDDQRLDGVVIATPCALHAGQAAEALARGMSVFCHKPLGRSAAEVREMVEAARRADRLLGVDFSYRHVRGVEQMRQLVRSGELGELVNVELVFHNADGPDLDGRCDAAQSGGGCVMDLGSHLLDLALWLLPGARVDRVQAQLHAQGRPLASRRDVEDIAEVHLKLGTDLGQPSARLACSWRLHAGTHAVIEATVYGTRGGVSLRNVDGSFSDFTVERYRGTGREVLAAPPDDWGARAAVAWARQLSERPRFDAGEGRALVEVAEWMDRVYAR
jgi:predicted dehydrogenase